MGRPVTDPVLRFWPKVEDVAHANIAKLLERREGGTIKGDGDDR